MALIIDIASSRVPEVLDEEVLDEIDLRCESGARKSCAAWSETATLGRSRLWSADDMLQIAGIFAGTKACSDSTVRARDSSH
jgi:hypothetical protein